MNPQYASYVFETIHPKKGLTVHLHIPSNRPISPFLKMLHTAAKEWKDEQDISLSTKVQHVCPPETILSELQDYLYEDESPNPERFKKHLSMLLERGTVHRFSIRPGAPVQGMDLVGREDTIERLICQLEKNSCHLMAPRRYGKTSLLRHISEHFENIGRPCLFVDLSPGNSALWFFVSLVITAMERPLCRQAIENLPELQGWPPLRATPTQRYLAGEQLRKNIEGGWWEFGRRLLDSFGKANTILLLDEFSVFLRDSIPTKETEGTNNRTEFELLSQTLQEFRRGSHPVRQVFAGSSGLYTYMQFHGMKGLFEDLHSFELPPLSYENGHHLVEELIYGAKLTPSLKVIGQVMEEVGEPIPYFVHALVDATRESCAGGEALSVETVRQAYQERILGPLGNHIFKMYRLQNQPYPQELRKSASRILQELSISLDGLSQTDLKALYQKHHPDKAEEGFESLFPCLQEDYDLVETNGNWRMRCKVIRDRWALSEGWLTVGA